MENKYNVIWLAVDENMNEVMCTCRPERDFDDFGEGWWHCPDSWNRIRHLPTGTIEMMTGIPEGNMTWSDEPICIELKRV